MKPRTLMMRIAIVVAVAVAMSATATAQKGKPAGGPTSIRVDGKIIKSYIEWLAAPEREGRRTLTPGYEQSVEWAVGKFKEWGVKPAGENGTYIQNVPISGSYVATTGTPELTADGRAFFFKDNDFVLDNRSTPGATASGEIVFVGYGISAPAKGLDEYAGIDVKDRIVLAFKGSPNDAPPARGMFGAAPPEPKSAEAWTAESAITAKVMTAYGKGAAAILLFDPNKLTSGTVTVGGPAPAAAVQMVIGGAAQQPLDPAAFTRPFLAVTDIDVRVFRQVMHRDPQESLGGFTARVGQIRRDIKGKTARSMATGIRGQVKGFATATFYGEKYKNNISHNVIGKVEGTDPKLKNQYIVVGGHMDHLGVRNGVIYPGADDDASGTATTMEMARLIATNAATIKPKRTIIFALWCGEEEGLVGSNYWGAHPTDGVNVDNVVADFNNDMVGLGDAIGAPGALNFPAIFDVVMKNQDPDVAKAVHSSTAGPGGSDYSTFIEKGIESLALMTEGGIGHPDYHDSGDRADRIDPEMLRKNGQFVLQGIINVANDTTATMVIPDRLHLYNGMRLAPLNMNELRTSSNVFMMVNGVLVQQPGRRPGLAPALDSWVFAGNTMLIDVAAKLFGLGRVDVRTDGTWFSTTVTDRGKEAIKSFEANGIVLNLVNPSKTLLLDVLANAKKPFIVSGLTAMPDGELAQQIKAKSVLVAVEFDAANPQAVATKLIEFKKLAGDSGNLLVTTRDLPQGRGEPGSSPARAMSPLEQARQQFYLALIKAGWTKDEINAMVGVSPRPTGPVQMPPAGFGRLGGNLAKLSPATPTT
jgi:hypothetical protein